MKYLFLGVFIVVTAVHLYASLQKNKRLRDLTKPFLLLLLLGFYLLAAKQVLVQIALALFFSWLGDVLLMRRGLRWFIAGGLAFMISHLFFVVGYLTDIHFAVLSLWAAAVPAAFILIVFLIIRKLRSHLPKALFLPMLLYLLINVTMNCFAVFRLLCLWSLPALVTCIGAVLFFISDAVLFFVRFNKNSRLKTHFLVMLTYSVGELLIVLGLL